MVHTYIHEEYLYSALRNKKSLSAEHGCMEAVQYSGTWCTQDMFMVHVLALLDRLKVECNMSVDGTYLVQRPWSNRRRCILGPNRSRTQPIHSLKNAVGL